jgi:pimeloyl-ACP methyl ester carboxylesterase
VLPLIPARYRVIAPDLRGHGDSEQPTGGYAMRDLAADVLALMDALAIQRATVVGHPIPAGFLDTAVQTSLRLPARVWRGIMAGMLATAPAPDLAGLGMPILVLSGDRDAVFPPAARQALLAQLPRARSVIYPATGHAPHWERPEVFAADLLAFFPGGGVR